MNTALSLRQTMNRIYKDLEGFKIPKDDEKAVKSSKGSPIYGEINQQALNTLLDYLNVGSKDIFYDLGSGVGKVVIQTALVTPVSKAYGVELSLTRYQEAQVALKRALEFERALANRVQFKNDDLLQANLSKASIIYTCSTAFSQSFMKTVCKRLAEFKHRFRLVSLQELPETPAFELLDILRLDMSWMRKTPVHIYRRT